MIADIRDTKQRKKAFPVEVARETVTVFSEFEEEVTQTMNDLSSSINQRKQTINEKVTELSSDLQSLQKTKKSLFKGLTATKKALKERELKIEFSRLLSYEQRLTNFETIAIKSTDYLKNQKIHLETRVFTVRQ